MEDQKIRDSIVQIIRNSFYQIIEDPNLIAIKENEYSCKKILQRMTELFFDIFQTERQTQSKQLKAQYSMLKEYCQNLSHEKYEMQRELQNEMIKINEETDKVSSNNTILNEEINLLRLKNEQFQIENKRIISEQEILLCQMNEQRITFQSNLEEMQIINNDLKTEVDLFREKYKKLDMLNEKQLQQIKEYSLTSVKLHNKIKEVENQYLLESQTKNLHLNELEQAQKKLKEYEQFLRKSNEENAVQFENNRVAQNQLQEYEKQMKILENLLNDKKREIIQLQKQHEQVLLLNEEGQKKFILNTINKYKEKIKVYKNKIQEYKEKNDEQNNKIHQLQLQDNEEKNGYQRQIQSIESQISQVQTQYETIISNIKLNSKNEIESLKEGYDKDLQYKEYHYRTELDQFEQQMKEKIKVIEERSVSKELFEESKKEKQLEIEGIEKEKNTLINELNNTIKQQSQQIDKIKEQNNTLSYQNAQNELLQNKNKLNEEQILKLNAELGKKQSMISELKEKIKQTKQETENIEREKTLQSEEIKNLEEQNNELQIKQKEIEKRLNQQIKALKDKSEILTQENYKITIELRDTRKEQEFERKQNQELLILLEKRVQGANQEISEVQTLRSSNAILQGKLENLNARLNDTKENYEEIRKEKEYLTNLIDIQNKKIRIADDLKIKFNIKIKSIMSIILKLKEEINIGFQKEFFEKLSYIKQGYISHIEELANTLLQLQNKTKQDEIQFILSFNELKQEFDSLQEKQQKFLNERNEQQKKSFELSPPTNKQKKFYKSDKKYKRKNNYENNKDDEEIEEDSNESEYQRQDKYYQQERHDRSNRCQQQDKYERNNRYEERYQRSDDEDNYVRSPKYNKYDNQKKQILRKSYSDSKGKGYSQYHNTNIDEDRDIYDQNIQKSKDYKNKNNNYKKNSDENEKKKQIESKKEKLLLEEYIFEDLKRFKHENQEMSEERIRFMTRIDDMSLELSQKQVKIDSLSSEMHIMQREAGLNQQEIVRLKRRISELEAQLRQIEDADTVNQELIIQDVQVKQESNEQKKVLIKQLQKEVAEYRQKEIENLKKISKYEAELEDKISQLNRLHLISQNKQANFEFKTKMLSEQREQAVQLHSHDQQITEYRDEIQNLLHENSHLLSQVQKLQTQSEGLNLELEKARIQVQIANQRENQLTNQNQQLQSEILSSHQNIQTLTYELQQLELSIQNEKLLIRQKLDLKKEKQLIKDKIEQQNIKEIHQMIENSYISLKKKNYHAYKSSIQLTSNFTPSNSLVNNNSTTNQNQNISNTQQINNLQYDKLNSNNFSALKQLNSRNSSSPKQNTFQNGLIKNSSISRIGLQNIPFQSQHQLQNITNNLHSRSTKNLSLHSTNTLYQQPNIQLQSPNNQTNQNNMQNGQQINFNIRGSSHNIQTNNFIRSDFVKNNSQQDCNDNLTQINNSNNQHQIRCHSQYQIHSNLQNPQLTSASSLLNNQYKYMSNQSTNIPVNHTFSTSINQNDYNQSTNKLFQSNSKSQSNLFASQNTTMNQTGSNNQLIKNQIANNHINSLSLKNDNKQETNTNKLNIIDKNRGKSLSNNQTKTYNRYEQKLNDSDLFAKSQNIINHNLDQYIHNQSSVSKDIDNFHPIKEETGQGLSLKKQREYDSNYSKLQRNSKLDQQEQGSQSINHDNTNYPTLKMEKLKSENESILKKLTKLQDLDKYLLRSRSQSSNVNVGSISVKNAINQSTIPSIQNSFLQSVALPDSTKFNTSIQNKANDHRNFKNSINNANDFTTKANDDLNSPKNNIINNNQILSKQKNFGSQNNEELNLTPPSQSLKSQQLINKPSNSFKESMLNKDETSAFTPLSNNNQQEAVSFADNQLLDILDNNNLKHHISSDQLSQQKQGNMLYKYVSQTNDLDNKQQNGSRRSQSVHNNQPNKI